MNTKMQSLAGTSATLASKSTLVAALMLGFLAASMTACAAGGPGAGDEEPIDDDDSEVCGPGCDSEEAAEVGAAEAPQGLDNEDPSPPVNGEHISEVVACEALLDAQTARSLAMGCFITTRACPSLLRVMTAVTCAEYDDGNVQGCIKRYREAHTCDDLMEAIEACVVRAYPGSEPAGCP